MRHFLMRIHPLMDYMLGSALVLPYICSFYADERETWILGLLGFLIITYSTITDYRGGAIKIISITVHKTLDVLCGLFLIVHPLLRASYPYQFYWPASIGFVFILIALCSSSKVYSLDKKDRNITQAL